MSELERQHGVGCSCTRCTGFQPGNEHRAALGNELAVKSGAYVSPLRLTDRIAEIATALRDGMPHWEQVFEPALQATAIAGARLERAVVALESAAPAQMTSLEADARGWHRQWLAGLEKLGLTPLSASRMGLNIVLAVGASAAAAARRKALLDHGAELVAAVEEDDDVS